MTVLSLDTKRYFIICHKGKLSTLSFKISQKVLNFLLLKTYIPFANMQTAGPQLPRKEGAVSIHTWYADQPYICCGPVEDRAGERGAALKLGKDVTEHQQRYQ